MNMNYGIEFQHRGYTHIVLCINQSGKLFRGKPVIKEGVAENFFIHKSQGQSINLVEVAMSKTMEVKK